MLRSVACTHSARWSPPLSIRPAGAGPQDTSIPSPPEPLPPARRAPLIRGPVLLPPRAALPTACLLQEQDRAAKERERADFRLAKEREREILRLEAERKKHLERMLREQVGSPPGDGWRSSSSFPL